MDSHEAKIYNQRILMLNRYYYFEEGLGGAANAVAASIPVTHLVRPGEDGNWRSLLDHHFSEEGNYPFCLALPSEACGSIQHLKDVLPLLFHPFYERSGDGKPLFIDGPVSGHGEAEGVVTEFFGRQRLAVDLIPLQGRPVTRKGQVRWLSGRSSDAGGAYYRYCLSAYDPSDIFVVDGREAQGGLLIDGLRRSLADLESRHPQWFRLAWDNFRLQKERDRLAATCDLLEEEKKIVQELLEMSNKHDEVSHILRFYRDEYEILPLWYKRFGHILKVGMGKRSFRSLYDKTTKKYKD